LKAVTVASLETHWSRFDAAVGNVTDDDIAEVARGAVRAATIRRLSDDTG
jgi:hypothetical protein